MAVKRKTLTHDQFFRLCKKLEKDKADIVNMDSPSIARVYSNLLGFDVSPVSVQTALDSIGVVTHRTKSRRGTVSVKQRLTDLETVMRRLCDQLGVTCTELGEEERAEKT